MSNLKTMKSTVRNITVNDGSGNAMTLNPIGFIPVTERISGDRDLSNAVMLAKDHGPYAMLTEIRKFPEFIRWIIVQSFIRAEVTPSKEDVEIIEAYVDGLSFDEMFDMAKALFEHWFPDLEVTKKNLSILFATLSEKSPPEPQADDGSATQANS
ncbi:MULTISPECIES: hypothetical protein [unclassified Ensifer]|uniref:hypothetical protein n=1 Tax=unclassified Ensifer TaxID=2633371 RepID=UPI0008137B5D|nr:MULTISPECIES: hypothetical protein [unclassified Ensifer]OCP07987.1 hypothetical protein BC362_10275 [Ensifer sp. LC14]OCP10903.1 hypothetical protein BC374_17690 [Ensifer sp. LC13]OCP11551.1 hypothetical protein BBX50_18165 [Ensifer sp. LC11]OCP33370.1 hypothetical protein BC364_17055 [Ensifer sp. LC499]